MTNLRKYLNRKIDSLKIKFSPNSLTSRHKQSVGKWKRDREEVKRYLYELGNDSLVFDLGGYEGQWSSDLYSRYRCKILIFEPVKDFAERIKKRFSANPDITLYQFGLSNKSGELNISLDHNSSSVFTEGSSKEKVKMVRAREFFTEHHIHTIDLMKINIEGGEYDLLDDLIASNMIGNIKNIQVQFHIFVPHAEERMKMIQKELSKSHHLSYQYPFVWENWEKNQLS
ncbi:MAG: FkbM family methyltransferase [Candidatus Taylorbacteria bacterium]